MAYHHQQHAVPGTFFIARLGTALTRDRFAALLSPCKAATATVKEAASGVFDVNGCHNGLMSDMA